MSKITRRGFIGSGLAALSTAAMPAFARDTNLRENPIPNPATPENVTRLGRTLMERWVDIDGGRGPYQNRMLLTDYSNIDSLRGVILAESGRRYFYHQNTPDDDYPCAIIMTPTCENDHYPSTAELNADIQYFHNVFSESSNGRIVAISLNDNDEAKRHCGPSVNRDRDRPSGGKTQSEISGGEVTGGTTSLGQPTP